MRPVSLLLVDDDRLVLDSMSDWLRDQGYVVAEAATCREALAAIAETAFDVVLTDIRLPDGDGFHILRHCRHACPDSTVILISGYATPAIAAEAVRAGAFALLTKPLIDEELRRSIDRALAQRRWVEEKARLKAPPEVRLGMDSIIGNDHRMHRMFDIIARIADTKATVLITGESGTGKSLVARAIHRRSARRDKAFVEVACGALPETLLESELFGHVAGAFTGASSDRMGKFLQAEGGTIFLDEVGTASPGLQVKLLRVLQEFAFEQVGGSKTFHVDTRVILATHENLTRAVAAGTFRQDLYYRINVINVELPPLRERISDIPLLAHYFLERVCEEAGKKVAGFADDALSVLQRYHWPGNVRELQNVVERAVLLGRHPQVMLEDLPRELIDIAPPIRTISRTRGHTLKEALEAPEREIILQTLQRLNWNRNATASQLGINRTTLYKKMKRLGLETSPRVAAGA